MNRCRYKCVTVKQTLSCYAMCVRPLGGDLATESQGELVAAVAKVCFHMTASDSCAPAVLLQLVPQLLELLIAHVKELEEVDGRVSARRPAGQRVELQYSKAAGYITDIDQGDNTMAAG
jgi:hypothetical protein